MNSPHSEPVLVRFAREYGWRAYAIPVLLVVTIWILVDITRNPQPDITTPAATTHAASHHRDEESKSIGPVPDRTMTLPIGIGDLPPGGSFAEAGDKSYRVVGKPGPKVGEGRDKAVTYVVEVENGVDTAAYGGDDAVAAMIDATLSNPKGWIADPAFSFQHVLPEENPTMRIQLASVATTHELCGHDLEMETSCYTSDGDRVVINESRWVRGAITASGDLGSYRQYLINHEVGHGIGYAAHAACPKNGDLAPVMMQQTLSLDNSVLHQIDPEEIYPDNQQACVFNPWPYPLGYHP
ncbi:DUF3152 domain-containing protein [Corynebacterium hindlerae]|uniref:DUF3152 domain-containing protein n=1 Tax=Corynebacterium hindlerae TaxID=699041 RepID=UPI003AAEC348